MLQRMLAVCWNLAVHCLCHSLDFFWGDSVFHIGFAGIIDVCCIEYIECNAYYAFRHLGSLLASGCALACLRPAYAAAAVATIAIILLVSKARKLF